MTGKHQTFPGSFLGISPYSFFGKRFRMCKERWIYPWNWSHTTITFMLWKSCVFIPSWSVMVFRELQLVIFFHVLKFICALNEIQFPLWEASHILTSARRVSFPRHRSLKLRHSHISCQTAELRWVTYQGTECECDVLCVHVVHNICVPHVVLMTV